MAPNLRPRLPAEPPAAEQPRVLSERMQRYISAKSEVKPFVPSEQQRDFFDWIVDGKGSLILRAGAGCGKTTTLIEALALMQGTIFFGAYNKDIAAEIKQKAREKHVERPGLFISTMHGAGFNDFMRVYKKATVDDRKVSRLIDTLAKEPGQSQLEGAKPFVAQMVSFGKQFLMGIKCRVDHMGIWRKLVDHFSADQSLTGDIEIDDALAWVIEIFQRSHAQCPEVIDFDDMIYAPLAYKCRLFQNDWVLIDEAQDVNPARREYAKRMLKPGGRLIAVGDDRQAIYGFTGAGGNAIELIKNEFGAAELPLSVTYRCPKAVVEYLYRFVPRTHIMAHPTAPEGEVRGVHYNPVIACSACAGTGAQGGLECTECNGARMITHPQRWFQQDPLLPTDVVLCRYNAPLLTSAFSLIREGIPCKVAGRDIGKGLIALCRTWKIKSLVKLEERLSAYLEREVAKAAEKDDERRSQEAVDKVECIRIFIERCKALGKHTIDELEVEIDAMFADKIENMVTFSSGHKAKGKEWPRVFWIQTAQRKRPNKEWEAEQEINVAYVIGSRVKGDHADPASGALILVPENLV